VVEAITNAVRHAQADSCTITLTIDPHCQVEISDNGRGLPVNYRAGVGLASMRERAEELGGTFQLQSTAGQGLAISVRLPLL
jgi:signal transduction histidine kinase